MYLTLDIIKKHLNLEPDFNDDDELLILYAQAAEEAVQVHCNDSIEHIAEKEGHLPAPLFQAMLLQIGQLYSNREVVGLKVNEIPFAYTYLINLYRNFD